MLARPGFQDGGCGLGWPGGKEALFWLGLREVERAAGGVVGLVVEPGAAPEPGAGGVEVPVVVEVEAVRDGQAGFGSVDLGHGDGPVHLDDRGAGLLGGRLVQCGDRPPVAGLMQVPVGDGRLQQAGTEGTVLAVFEMGGATCPWRLTRSCGGYERAVVLIAELLLAALNDTGHVPVGSGALIQVGLTGAVLGCGGARALCVQVVRCLP